MIDLAASDPVDLQPGDRIEMATEIRRGDLVCIERVAPDRVRFRAVLPADPAPFGGALYRIDRDEASGQIVLRAAPPAEP